jgi:hypothetical protein
VIGCSADAEVIKRVAHFGSEVEVESHVKRLTHEKAIHDIETLNQENLSIGPSNSETIARR